MRYTRYALFVAMIAASILSATCAAALPAGAEQSAATLLPVADTVSAGGQAETGPRAVGQPGALDQVESWINENADLREENATSPATVGDMPLPAGLTREADLAQVDWGAGSIVALGVADASGGGYNPAREEAMAMRRATLQARKQLQDAVFGLPLDGRQLVGAALGQQQRADLRGKLQNSPIARRSEPDGLGGVRIEVEARASLRGELAGTLIPSSVAFQSHIPPTIELTVGSLHEGTPDMDQLAYRRSMAELGAFTGLVVDARGLDGAPALLPVVAGPDGTAAFGAFQAPRAVVLKDGLVVYAHAPDDATARRRAGGTPLVVRALAVSGEHRADVVVSTADADLIRELFRNETIAAACPVAIIMD